MNWFCPAGGTPEGIAGMSGGGEDAVEDDAPVEDVPLDAALDGAPVDDAPLADVVDAPLADLVDDDAGAEDRTAPAAVPPYDADRAAARGDGARRLTAASIARQIRNRPNAL